jgi:SAM-dependent methyltransferase
LTSTHDGLLRRVRDRLRREGERLRHGRNLRGNRRKCYVCGATFDHFLPYREGRRSPFTRLLGCVGSDTENFYCPACECFDRERHLFMYFDKLGLWDAIKGGRVLHVAPEAKLAERIAASEPAEYVKGDIAPGPDRIKLDVTAIAFPDEYFDLVICNHVLEHVPDDGRAMAELFRVLKPGGRAVLQTPFSPVLAHTFQDPGIDTDEKRCLFYGQEDHVRLYGQDLFEKLKGAGFSVALGRHAELFRPEEASYYGVNPAEDLLLLRRGG